MEWGKKISSACRSSSDVGTDQHLTGGYTVPELSVGYWYCKAGAGSGTDCCHIPPDQGKSRQKGFELKIQMERRKGWINERNYYSKITLLILVPMPHKILLAALITLPGQQRRPGIKMNQRLRWCKNTSRYFLLWQFTICHFPLTSQFKKKNLSNE